MYLRAGKGRYLNVGEVITLGIISGPSLNFVGPCWGSGRGKEA